MRSSFLLLSAAAILTSSVYCSPIDSSNNHHEQADEPKLVRLPIKRRPRSGNVDPASLRKRDPFAAPLYNDQGSQYLVEVGVGTPAQNFTVTFDTGSADLWVPSTSCSTTECPYARFDSSASSTFKDISSNFSIEYGIGSVKGVYATDTVTVAGVSVENQQFGLASTTADILTTNSVGGSGSDTPSANSTESSDVVGNGILGLGYPQLTSAASKGGKGYNPFVFNLVEQNLISQHIFSVYMNSASEDGWAGEVIFGGVDNSKFSGNITYLPVAKLQTSSNPLSSIVSSSSAYFYWMTYGQGIAVENPQSTRTSNNISFDQVTAFIIDTGTTLTYLPNDMAVSMAESLVGSGNYALDTQSQVFVADCSAAKSDAALVLSMSQSSKVSPDPVTITVPASQLLIPLDGPTTDTASVCMLGVAPIGSNNNMLLVGDSVLRSTYLVFDIEHNQIGFASAANVEGKVNGVGADNTSSGSSNVATLFLPLLMTFGIMVLFA
ncbi:acid protease [Lichtheimia hyalospora FSU 10163]|nr:acid protease [Lichtheimia hyalospora FSU 10163]